MCGPLCPGSVCWYCPRHGVDSVTEQYKCQVDRKTGEVERAAEKCLNVHQLWDPSLRVGVIADLGSAFLRKSQSRNETAKTRQCAASLQDFPRACAAAPRPSGRSGVGGSGLPDLAPVMAWAA